MSGPGLLADLHVVEVAAFIAAPLGTLTLAQLGADVVRIDPIGGNIDIDRWPLAPNGDSLYWAGLNKGKRSVCLNLDDPRGREIAGTLIGAPGEGGGLAVTNLPARGWLGYEELSRRRRDLVLLRLTGNPDGSAAVDYTVNCASGFAIATGRDEEPVNHVLPAWDVAAGLYIATALLAAERSRRRTGCGQAVTLALADVMLSTVATLGYVADVLVNGTVRPPLGNDLYGAFGRNFRTADGRQIMLAAISDRQWRAIGHATGLGERLAMVGPLMDVDLATEGGRFEARHAIAAVLEPWFARRTLVEIRCALDGSGVLWGPYQDFGQLVREDPRCSAANPMFEQVDQPGLGPVLASGSPLAFSAAARVPPAPPPRLGEHTDEVLAERLGMTGSDIAALRDAGVVAGPGQRRIRRRD